MKNILSAKDHESLLKAAILQYKLALAVSVWAGDEEFELPYLQHFTFGQHSLDCEQLQLSKGDEKLAGSILEHSATYILTLQIDKALQDTIPDRFRSPDADIQAAAWIARLIRNAFSHNPLSPSWDIQPEAQNRIFEIAKMVKLETDGLDGQPVRTWSYGGSLALLALAEFVLTKI